MTTSPLAGPLKVASALIVVYSASVGFLPLFAGPTYEAALAAGAAYPVIIAVVVARSVVRLGPLPSVALRIGATVGAGSALAGLAVFCLHGARVGFCDPLTGIAHFLLAPGAGAVLAGVWGGAVGVLARELTRRPSAAFAAVIATVLAISAPLGGIGLSVFRFYTSPMIFAFDPFFGYFSGTLYDTVISAASRLATYRAGSAATLLGAFALSDTFVRDADGALRWQPWGRPVSTVLGAGCAFASLLVTLEGPALGHFQTTTTISQALGQRVLSERCTVLYGAGIRAQAASVLARECNAHLTELERTFEIPASGDVTVFLFRDAEQKGWLMGASHTYIAKPWRREVYLQHQAYPHPVLAHELAHVVAGSFGVGPFLVAGPLGGWLPDPGRIEGIAVAAAPPQDAELTSLEWSAAMRRLNLLPPLASVFRLSFLGINSSSSYTVAGAFVGWIKDEYGAAALRRWYGGESLEAVTGLSWTELERGFGARLDATTVSDAALAVARARFDRPAVFGRRCPHDVDRLLGEAALELGSFRPIHAQGLFDQALSMDPSNFGARISREDCALVAGEPEAARKGLAALSADRTLLAAQRAVIEERLGDMELRAGNAQAAQRHFRAAAEHVVSEDQQRLLAVKEYAATSPYRDALTALLAPDPVSGADWGAASAALARWSAEEPKDGLPEYLLGKNQFNQGHWRLAAEHLDRALGRHLPTLSLEREAVRTRVLCACALGDANTAVTLSQRYEALAQAGSRGPAVSTARRAEFARTVKRCVPSAVSTPDPAVEKP